jgi:hypothetical protein
MEYHSLAGNYYTICGTAGRTIIEGRYYKREGSFKKKGRSCAYVHGRRERTSSPPRLSTQVSFTFSPSLPAITSQSYSYVPYVLHRLIGTQTYAQLRLGRLLGDALQRRTPSVGGAAELHPLDLGHDLLGRLLPAGGQRQQPRGLLLGQDHLHPDDALLIVPAMVEPGPQDAALGVGVVDLPPNLSSFLVSCCCR